MDKLKEKLKENKKAIIFLVLILLVFWLYKRSGTEIEPLISVLDGEGASQQIIGKELIDELQRLKDLNRINVDFFDNPDFQSLEDISVEVSPQPLGRTNPFIPYNL